MAKTQQEELLLQEQIVGYEDGHKKGPLGLRGQGFWAEKTSERFKAGRPDLRISRSDVGQLDVELKYIDQDINDRPVDFGFTKLQWLKMRQMNRCGMPCVGLVYMKRESIFLLTVDRVLDGPLPVMPKTCLKLPAPRIIDGVELVQTAKEYLRELGYTYTA